MASDYYPGIELIDRQLRVAGAFSCTMDGIRRRDATYRARNVSYDRVTEAQLEQSCPPVAPLVDNFAISRIVGVCRKLDKPPLDCLTVELLRLRLLGWTLAELSAVSQLKLTTVAGRIRRVIPRVTRAMPSSKYALLADVLREAYLVELHSSWPDPARLRAVRRLSMR